MIKFLVTQVWLCPSFCESEDITHPFNSMQTVITAHTLKVRVATSADLEANGKHV
jgi:CRISPR-associated DxTHG motif protein